MIKHFGIYTNSGDVQTAINEETLINPYVALVSGSLDYNSIQPEPEPTCEEQGLCGEYPDCYSCDPSDPSGDDSGDDCGGDPECECNQESGYNWWEEGTCHSCEEEWESLGYSSPEECACAKRGEDSGVCPEPDESGQDESE